MKNRLIRKIVAFTILASVGTTILTSTLSPKTNTLSEVQNIVENDVVDFIIDIIDLSFL